MLTFLDPFPLGMIGSQNQLPLFKTATGERTQMTENCTENHLIKAIEADDALTDELIAMVRHTGCPDDENAREARYDLATEFIHSDAV